jgi:hypothetical protein
MTLVMRVYHHHVHLVAIINTHNPHDQNIITSNSVIESEAFMTQFSKTLSRQQLSHVVEL